jgi:hypothetical protein
VARRPLPFQNGGVVVVVKHDAAAAAAAAAGPYPRAPAGRLSWGEAPFGGVGRRGFVPPGGHLFPKLQHRQTPGADKIEGRPVFHDGAGLKKDVVVLHVAASQCTTRDGWLIRFRRVL